MPPRPNHLSHGTDSIIVDLNQCWVIFLHNGEVLLMYIYPTPTSLTNLWIYTFIVLLYITLILLIIEGRIFLLFMEPHTYWGLSTPSVSIWPASRHEYYSAGHFVDIPTTAVHISRGHAIYPLMCLNRHLCTLHKLVLVSDTGAKVNI